MEATTDIGMLGAAFDHPGEASQSIFRAALEALSRPGTAVTAAHTAQWPRGMGQAAGAVLLALLDQDTRLWISTSANAGVIASYLRFHTGCTIVDSPAEADFAFVDDPVRLPALIDFPAGSETYPDRSATVVVEVAAIDGRGWVLTGPGIEHRACMAVAIPGPRFMAQWRAQRRRFPCGVDMVLACGERFAALPRTTTIEED
jgi:alpha-D-ribose 1-methylphosphonate 5-triphosphate synthase subunit PhnH